YDRSDLGDRGRTLTSGGSCPVDAERGFGHGTGSWNDEVPGVQLPINTKKMPELGRLGSHMERSCLVNHRLLGLGKSFLHQKVFCPGWIKHFHAIGIWPAEVLMKSPGERPIAQMNQPYSSQSFEDFSSKRPVDFHIDHHGDRPIMGRRNVNQLMRRSSYRRGLDVEGAGKVD